MLSQKNAIVLVALGVLFALAAFYSDSSQWGIVSPLLAPNNPLSLVNGFVYGLIAAFYLSKLKWKLVGSGGVAFALVAAFVFQTETQLLSKALMLGIFLMAFDWAFENLGAKFGYWFSKSSAFFVGAVPIEVMIGAIGGGFGWALFMPRTFNLLYILLASLIVGCGGAFGENSLQKAKELTYGNGWTWVYAVISYSLVWIMLSLVWYFVINV
jgi:hypothetical protein